MKRVIGIFLALGFLTLSTVTAHAGLVVKGSRSRGVFTLAPVLISKNLRLMNSDGSFASYTGQGYGALLDVSVIGSEDESGISLFAAYTRSTLTNTYDSRETMIDTQAYTGFKGYLGYGFFVGGGWALTTLNLKAIPGNVSLNSNSVGAGLGISFLNITDSVDVTLQAWYRIGLLPKQQNSDLAYSSGFDSWEAVAGLRWSPAGGF